MDRRIREWIGVEERLPNDNEWPCALARIDQGDFDWIDAWQHGPIPKEITHWMSLALLTAEPEPCPVQAELELPSHPGGYSGGAPEPCEDARRAAQDFAAWLDVNAHDSYPVDSVWYDQLVQRFDAHASQIADKREEDLRAMVETLREALEDRATYSYYYDRDVPHQSQHEHCRCRKCVDDRVKKALAATEPKP